MDKHKKKIINYVLIFLATVVIVSISLYAVGQSISSTPLMISGLIAAGIGFVPLLIIVIILYFKQSFR